MNHKQFIAFIFAILVILYSGCGDEGYPEGEFYPVNISLAPRTQDDVSPKIDKIAIIVEGDDIVNPIENDYSIAIETSEFSGTIDIPIGSDRKITVEAYEEENLIYAGSKTITGQELVDISTTENPLIEIKLDPVDDMLIKLFPYKKVVNKGDSFTIDIVAKNFSVLFGISFRLKFDETYIEPVEVDAIGVDKLLGKNVFFIDDIDQSSREKGSLSIGITRLIPDETPKDDEEENEKLQGVIASVKFESVESGETTVKIDYDSLVWTEGSEFLPPTVLEPEKLELVKEYSGRGETAVIVND